MSSNLPAFQAPLCGGIIQQTSDDDDDVRVVTEAEKEAADEDAEKKQVAKFGPFTADETGERAEFGGARGRGRLGARRDEVMRFQCSKRSGDSYGEKVDRRDL